MFGHSVSMKLAPAVLQDDLLQWADQCLVVGLELLGLLKSMATELLCLHKLPSQRFLAVERLTGGPGLLVELAPDLEPQAVQRGSAAGSPNPLHEPPGTRSSHALRSEPTERPC